MSIARSAARITDGHLIHGGTLCTNWKVESGPVCAGLLSLAANMQPPLEWSTVVVISSGVAEYRATLVLLTCRINWGSSTQFQSRGCNEVLGFFILPLVGLANAF